MAAPDVAIEAPDVRAGAEVRRDGVFALAAEGPKEEPTFAEFVDLELVATGSEVESPVKPALADGMVAPDGTEAFIEPEPETPGLGLTRVPDVTAPVGTAGTDVAESDVPPVFLPVVSAEGDEEGDKYESDMATPDDVDLFGVSVWPEVSLVSVARSGVLVSADPVRLPDGVATPVPDEMGRPELPTSGVLV